MSSSNANAAAVAARRNSNDTKRTTLCNILKANTRLAYLGHVLEDLDINTFNMVIRLFVVGKNPDLVINFFMYVTGVAIDITNLNLRNDLRSALSAFNSTL